MSTEETCQSAPSAPHCYADRLVDLIDEHLPLDDDEREIIRRVTATSVHAIVRQLSFQGNIHQIQRAEALGFVFLVGPKPDGQTWRWATWSDGDKSYHWHDCDTRETAIAHCNRRWRELLEPYLEV